MLVKIFQYLFSDHLIDAIDDFIFVLFVSLLGLMALKETESSMGTRSVWHVDHFKKLFLVEVYDRRMKTCVEFEKIHQKGMNRHH